MCLLSVIWTQTTKKLSCHLDLLVWTILGTWLFCTLYYANRCSCGFLFIKQRRIKGLISRTNLEKCTPAFFEYFKNPGLQLKLTTATVLMRTKRSERITPVLKSSYWLPVTYGIDFNTKATSILALPTGRNSLPGCLYNCMGSQAQ